MCTVTWGLQTSPLGPCTGCFLNGDSWYYAPCDDNLTASTGAQQITADFSVLPREWLELPALEPSTISCDVFDIFATPSKGTSIGRFNGGWSAIVPPHGVRFIRLTGCTASGPSLTPSD